MEAYDKAFEYASNGSYDEFIEHFNSLNDNEREQLIHGDFDGVTIFIAACIGGSLEIVDFIVKTFNVDVNKKCDVSIDGNYIQGVSALWCASYYAHFEVVKYLVDHGSQINLITSTMSTPLRAACYNGDIEIVKLLVEKNANIEATNESGETCLMCGK